MIRLNDVTRTYMTKKGAVDALAGVTLVVNDGDFVVLTGPSGSGKTTLLWMLGAMLKPTSGRVEFDGRDLYAMNHVARGRFRANEIGFVFQASHLLPYLTLRDNVRLGQTAASRNGATERDVDALLERLGLAARASHRPSELSAGEQQRAALARAMIKRPKLVLADEPAGNLDPTNAAEVLKVLREYHEEGGTVVLVTHGLDASAEATRAVQLESGRIVGQD